MRAIRTIPATIGLVMLLVGLPPRLALAAESTEDDANAAALAGRYPEALEVYAKLYSKTREPTYLHNIARCYQKLGRPDEAIDYFNKYLQLAKDLDEGVKVEVRGYIREMEVLREKMRGEKAPGALAVPRPVPAPVPAVPPTPTLIRTAPPVSPASGGLAPERHERSGASASSRTQFRSAGAIGAGIGIFATGVGVYYGIRTWMLEDQVAGAARFDEAKDREGQSARTWQFVMYGVGAACFAGSAVLYYLSLETGRPSDGIAVLPSIGPTFAGGSVTARF